ncbi:ribosome-binding protein 1 [Babesia caballi]|uniref:Ribosome-binding protein 1 n=1 Tax=Babesia caballi TaxID=5871 RepID=A0AAV4LM96_BABCB|nr:ribosome-binding protein 1 [Babesia caballi]
MTENCSIKKPNTFKEALDFAGALSVNSHGLNDLVGTALELRVATASGLDIAPKSVAVGGSTNIGENFKTVIKNLNELRKLIVNDSGDKSYGDYGELESSGDPSCAKLCAGHILDILPQLYATLEFLYFKVGDDSLIGGGNWRNETCNGAAIGAWLVSKSSLPLAVVSQVGLLPGGFEDNEHLSKQQGSSLQSKLGALVRGAGGREGTSLHNLLLDLAIVTKWSSCSVATCMVMLATLCDGVKTKFQNQLTNYHGMERVLTQLSSTLKPFAPEQNRESDAYFVALFGGSPQVYSNRLTENTLLKHLSWFSSIITSLIAHLTAIVTECTHWSKESFQNSSISGSFAYGFSFGDKCKSNLDNTVKNEIPNAITKLNEDLTGLQQILEKYFKTSEPSSSTASAVGGILGIAAVGGAGAAFVFNVGGVATIVRGALGILK